jgi:hypothetical protein
VLSAVHIEGAFPSCIFNRTLFLLVLCHHHVPLQMVKRPNADISHHGPHEHDRPCVLHTAFPSVSKLPPPHRIGRAPLRLSQRTQNRRRCTGARQLQVQAWILDLLVAEARSKKREEIVVLFVVQDVGLYRNVCSAILDAEKFPYLRTTPLWLRGVFAAVKLLPTARKRLVEWMLYIQLQVICYKHGYWEYHGGINALRWWQWTHPFNVGRHPAWTVRLQFRSQRFFSKAVQGTYYWVGRSLFGMKGD